MANEGNSRVTLAVLGTKIDNLTEKVETGIEDGKAREARLREVEREQTRLKTIVGVWNSINTLGVIAVTAFKGYINGE